MTKQKLIDLTPLFILTGGLVATLIVTQFRVTDFGYQLWGGLTFTCFSWLVYFRWRTVYNKTLGLTLMLGTINLIEFLPITITVAGGVSGRTIGLQLFSLLTLLIYSYFNRQRIKQIIGDIIKVKSLTEKELIDQKERRIEGFKLRYKDRSSEELKRISNSAGTFDEHAIEAAKKLLAEKDAR